MYILNDDKKTGCSRFGAKLLLETVEFIWFCIDFSKMKKECCFSQKNRAERGSKLNKCDDKILLFARSEYPIKFRLWWHKNWFPQNLLKKCTFFYRHFKWLFRHFLFWKNRHLKWRFFWKSLNFFLPFGRKIMFFLLTNTKQNQQIR